MKAGDDKMPEKPAREQDKFVLRMPDGLRERIATAARTNSRSMNAEIIQVLMEHYPQAPTDDELVEQIEVFLEWAQDPQSTAYRLPLLETLRDLSSRLSIGEDRALSTPRDALDIGTTDLN